MLHAMHVRVNAVQPFRTVFTFLISVAYWSYNFKEEMSTEIKHGGFQQRAYASFFSRYIIQTFKTKLILRMSFAITLFIQIR